MRLNDSAHLAQPWRIHALTPDFALEDVWALDTPGGPDDFAKLVELVAAGDPAERSSKVVGALFALRWKLGELLGWDDERDGLGARVPTLRERLPEDLRDGPAGPAADAVPFKPLYLTHDEFAAEIANRTMHGVMHLGWVGRRPRRPPRADGGARQAQRAPRRRLHGRDQALPPRARVPADDARDRAPVAGARLTQADRRARSRAALLEAAARGLSRAGYTNLNLGEVAAEAGYTRGALYHQFADKEALVLATVAWVNETWFAEVGSVFEEMRPPVETLVELARRHAVYCRRDIAGVMAALRVEFGAREHPVGDAVRAVMVDLIARVRTLIEQGRADRTIPPGPPARELAGAALAAIEGAVIALAGRPGDDEEIAERVVRGLLGVG